jgi:hypothetical protein
MRYEVNEGLMDYILELYKEFLGYMQKDDFFHALKSLRAMICFVPNEFETALLLEYDRVVGGISEDSTKDLTEKMVEKMTFANDLYRLFNKIHSAFDAGGMFTKKTTSLREEV